MSYIFSDKDGVISSTMSSFLFYMPFNLMTAGRISLTWSQDGLGCYFGALMDGSPNDPQPRKPENRRSAVAQEIVTIKAADDSLGEIVLQHMTLKRRLRIERENEWSELWIYHGDKSSTGKPNWFDTSKWTMTIPDPNNFAHQWTKTVSFGEIESASCDSTVLVENDAQRVVGVTLFRRMTSGTIVKEIANRGTTDDGGGEVIPDLVLSSKGNSDDVVSPPDRKLFGEGNKHSTPNRSGFVIVAAGVFADQSADTLIEEWRGHATSLGMTGGVDSLETVAEKLGRIAFAPENVVSSRTRQLRKLHNLHLDQRAGITSGSGILDTPFEVLFVEAGGNGHIE